MPPTKAPVRKLDPKAIVGRMKEAHKICTDEELACRFGVSVAALYSGAEDPEVLGDWILSLWNEKGISMDWVLTGKGSMERRY